MLYLQKDFGAMKYDKNSKISSLEDVDEFVNYVINGLGVNYHPDESFGDYVVMGTDTPSFSAEEAALLDRLNDECWDICEKNGVEIYYYGIKYHPYCIQQREECGMSLEEQYGN